MNAPLISVGVVGVALLFVGCSQPIAPTSPTSPSSASLSSASSEANATGAGVLSHDQDVPFKGRLEGTATITPGTPPFVSVLIKGTGNATHLGLATERERKGDCSTLIIYLRLNIIGSHCILMYTT